MLIKNRKMWEDFCALNQDEYGKAICAFAERWADRMEEYLQCDQPIAEMAERACREADIDGISGFMYGCAVKALSLCWTHGDTLRQWHNAQWGGEDANQEPGAVINPAVIRLEGAL